MPKDNNNKIIGFLKYITSKEGIPNIISTLRIVSIIPICYMYAVGLQLPASILFGIASASDFVDGNLARHWHVESKYGKYADAVGDKALVIPAIVIHLINTLSLNIESLLLTGMLAFECAIGATNLFSKFYKKKNVDSSKIGKIKTVSLMGTIFLSMLSSSIDNTIFNSIANIAAPILTITLQSISLKDYVKIFQNKNVKGENINNISIEKVEESKKEFEKTKDLVKESTNKFNVQNQIENLRNQRETLLNQKNKDEEIVKSPQKTFKFDKNKRNK